MKLFGDHISMNILIFSMLFIARMVSCDPPQDHLICSSGNTNCTITNSYGSFPDRSICHAAQAAYPTTENELVSVVAQAAMQNRKIKVATNTTHSIPKLSCPDGNDGLIISTKFLNRTLNVNVSSGTITVEPGVTLRHLIGEAARAGLALPYTPYWWGLTVAGMLGTGSHGSTLSKTGSAVHDSVIGLRIVTPATPENGYAVVRTLERGNPDLDAAKVSLGVLGVISQVTLQLQPMFKRSIRYLERNDSDLADRAVSFGSEHEFADMVWYPSLQRVYYRIDDRVPSNTSGNGLFDFVGFRSRTVLALAPLRVVEEAEEFNHDALGKCILARATTAVVIGSSFGLTNNGNIFSGYPVIGNHSRLQSSGTCLDSPRDGLFSACPWDPRVYGLFYYQTTFSITLSNVKSFIQDVQNLIALEPRSMCGVDLYYGFLMRYVTASSAYLGKEEDSIDFDITYYKSKDPTATRLFQDILEEIEQIAIFKYGGLPHWGKNRNVAFIDVSKKYRNINEFRRVKEEYDPMGLFSSEWSDQMLGLKDGVTIDRPGCALDGLCICQKDSDCAPDRGYFCQPGKIYLAANVCAPTSSITSSIEMNRVPFVSQPLSAL